LPDVRGRRKILEMYLKDIHLAADVDLSTISRATPGFSGADLFRMVNQAKIMASVENGRNVTMHHLEQSKDEMLMGVERKSAVYLEDDRRLTAIHESGHAIVALYSPDAMSIHKATIMPRGKALGMVSQLPDSDELSLTRAQLLARIDVAMGGRVAEELIYGPTKVTTGAQSDFSTATSLAKAMVTQYGMSEKLGPLVLTTPEDWETVSPSTRQIIDSEVSRLLDESKRRATQIVEAHRAQLEKLANALLENETLNKEQIEFLIFKDGNINDMMNNGTGGGGGKKSKEKKPPNSGIRVGLDVFYP